MSAKNLLRVVLCAAACGLLWSAEAWSQAPFVRGDVDCNGVIDDLDIQALQDYLFTGAPIPCHDAGDVDDNGLLAIADLAALTNYVYTGAPVPRPPFPDCGLDPTPDGLGCATFCCGGPWEHFKSWRLQPQDFHMTVTVRDQFMDDELSLTMIEFLSNPARKDSFDVIWPDDHLTWYRASGRDTLLQVEFINQFGVDTVIIDSAAYLLLPTQKLPHPPPSPDMDHYKAYRIRNPQTFLRPTELQDQFDPLPERVDSLTPVYFLTPASKNGEQVFDPVRHYVAYEFSPKTDFVDLRTTIDQFGGHEVLVERSELLLVPTFKLSVTPQEPSETLRNHFKTWRIDYIDFDAVVTVADQFMTDELVLQGQVFLSNPARKDTSEIKRPDDHLNWYVANGRDTLLEVVFENQFGLDTVVIDSVRHLLVPCQKLPHEPPDDLLGHYKSYRIRDGQAYWRPDGTQIELQDQFDLQPEYIDSVVPVLFLTPAMKNSEPMPESDTHYVAYEIFPKTDVEIARTTVDQFSAWNVVVRRSVFLLVPSHKIAWGPPPAPDTLDNHFKGWQLDPIPFDTIVHVVDPFMSDYLDTDSIKVLANPTVKDTFEIIRPDDHLLWYSVDGRDTCLGIVFENQFGTDTFVVGTVTHLLLPAQKLPHEPPDPTLDHYKAYKVWKPERFGRTTVLQDQFDAAPFTVDALLPMFLCTPASKNTEPVHDSSLYYVAYEFFPKQENVITRSAVDQFGLHLLATQRSALLMVPTEVFDHWYFCPIEVPGDVDCSGAVTSADIIRLVNYVFKPGPAPCPCDAAGDANCDGSLTAADIIWLVNFVFKGGPPPCDPCTIIPSKWECSC